jgi:hypothetical protein
MDVEEIWRIAAEIPEEWYESDHCALHRLVEDLYNRRGMIRDLIVAFHVQPQPLPRLDGKLVLPIFWRCLDAPHIAGLIQRQSQQPKPFVFADRDAVDYSRGSAGFRRETFQPYGGANVQRTTEASCATLRVYENHHTSFGKRLDRVEARQCGGDLARNSSTSPSRRIGC